jgi:gamma-glutamylaminecyclotransferase
MTIVFDNITDIFVFVYGSLKKGFVNSRYLSFSDYVGDFVSEKPFHMIVRINGTYPYLLEDCAINKEKIQVKGEIYKVSRYVLGRLDSLESHPDYYQRTLHKFTDGVRIIEAWVYILAKETIINFIENEIDENYFLVESGNWTQA